MAEPQEAELRDRGRDRKYLVAIMCPNTGFPSPTGFGVTKESFRTSSYSRNSFSCGNCGQIHTWDKPEAILVVARGKYNGETFESEDLILDGSEFDRCKILSCKIHLSRGNFRLTNTEIAHSTFNFKGEAEVVKSIADMLAGN